MYNAQLSRREFLQRGLTPVATAVGNNLGNKLSIAVGALGGLVGVVATHETSSAQDLTPQQMANYLTWFFDVIEQENAYRENRPYLKTARCMPTKAILFDGTMDGESVRIEVKANDRYKKLWAEINPVDAYTTVMGIVPKNAPSTTDYYLREWLGSTSGSTFVDDGLKISLMHPNAEVLTTDVQKMESVRWVRGGYDLTKYHAPKGGCDTEVGRIQYCFEADALYDTTGFRGEEVRTKPHFTGDYYKRIGHDNLMKRREAGLKAADTKYRGYLQTAVKSDMAKRKARGICHLSDTVMIIPPGITEIPIKKY